MEGDAVKASSISQALTGSEGVQEEQPDLPVLQMGFCQLWKQRNKQELSVLLCGRMYVPMLIVVPACWGHSAAVPGEKDLTASNT